MEVEKYATSGAMLIVSHCAVRYYPHCSSVHLCQFHNGNTETIVEQFVIAYP